MGMTPLGLVVLGIALVVVSAAVAAAGNQMISDGFQQAFNNRRRYQLR